MKVRWTVVLVSMMLIAPTWIEADLHDRGNGLIYDDELDITWLQDTNLAESETFGVGGIAANGEMTWATAQEWIAAMNAANYKGFNTWRLPGTVQPDPNCTTQHADGDQDGNCILSELPNLHTVTLGNPYEPTTDCSFDCWPDISPFENFEDFIYWSIEDPQDSDRAYAFAAYCGGQCHTPKTPNGDGFLVWPVLDGDVVAGEAVPTAPPLALALVALGLLAAAWWVLR